MKHYLKFTCLGLAMVFLLTGCGTFMAKTSDYAIGEGSGKGELVIQEKQTFQGNEFNKIDVVTDAMEIIVKQGEGEETTVELLKDNGISSELAFDASIKNEVLRITVNTKEQLFSLGDDQRGERKLMITLAAETEPALNIQNEFGKVSLDGIALSSAAVELSAGMIEAMAVQGELDLTNSAGNIVVKQASNQFPVKAFTEAGNIDIGFAEAPADARFELMVEVGKVKLDLDDVSLEEKRNTIIKGQRGSDGPLIKANASVGNIHVH